VLITGGLGFIGSNLAHALAAAEARVSIADSLIPLYGGNKFNIHGIEGNVQVKICDLREADKIRQLVKGQDFIFNLAGQVSHIDSMRDPFTDLEINCRSQLTLLEACRNSNPGVKVLYAGTRNQYGKADYLPVDEKHLTHPTDVNGVDKLAGEMYHLIYKDNYNIRTCSLRMTNTYGPRHVMKTPRQGFLAWFIRQAIDNETIKVFGDGKQQRDFNYVDDVVSALLLAALSEKSEGKIYNLGTGKPVSVGEAAQAVVEVAGSGKIDYVPFPEDKKKIEIGNYYADYSRAKKDLGWIPRTEFREGLRKTIEYYKKFKKHYWQDGIPNDSFCGP